REGKNRHDAWSVLLLSNKLAFGHSGEPIPGISALASSPVRGGCTSNLGVCELLFKGMAASAVAPAKNERSLNNPFDCRSGALIYPAAQLPDRMLTVPSSGPAVPGACFGSAPGVLLACRADIC